MKRVLLLGTAGSGKTAFLNRVDHGTFESRYVPNERAIVRSSHGMEWIDFPGHDLFASLESVGHVDMIALVYSAGSVLSARALIDLHARALATFGPVPAIVIRTGGDILHRHRYSIRGEIEISSKTGRNATLPLHMIRDTFQRMTTESLNKYKEELIAKACDPSRYVRWCLDTEEQSWLS